MESGGVVAADGADCRPRRTSSATVSVNSLANRPIWLRTARIELPTPQRSANFISVAGVAGPASDLSSRIYTGRQFRTFLSA